MSQLPSIFLIVFLLISQIALAKEVIYRGLGAGKNPYHSELLELIFEQAKPNTYTVKLFETKIPHFRAFKALEENTELDLVIGYATNERIEKYLAIPYPIRKGINGWRIPLVHSDNKEMFKQVNSLTALQPYSAGMFHDWSDNDILFTNGIPIVKGSSFNGLFQMLDKKRFDYIPISILYGSRNIKNLTQNLKLNIMLSPDILITYPTCFYFYVNKSNTELASVLTAGFEKIIANGQYNALFEKHYGDAINQIFAQPRKIIQLQNPLLPTSVPVNRPELWLIPQ